MSVLIFISFRVDVSTCIVLHLCCWHLINLPFFSFFSAEFSGCSHSGQLGLQGPVVSGALCQYSWWKRVLFLLKVRFSCCCCITYYLIVHVWSGVTLSANTFSSTLAYVLLFVSHFTIPLQVCGHGVAGSEGAGRADQWRERHSGVQGSWSGSVEEHQRPSQAGKNTCNAVCMVILFVFYVIAVLRRSYHLPVDLISYKLTCLYHSFLYDSLRKRCLQN